MRKVELEEHKRIQLEILEEIDFFCREHSLRYSLSSGSLLGAVRHQGYIPWDDDIDLMMPRADYERFALIYESDKNEVIDLRKLSFTVEGFLKVSRKHTKMYDGTGRTSWGINIDVFPIDGVPENAEQYCRKISSMRKTFSHICPYYKAIDKNKTWWKIKYILKRIRYPYIGSPLSLKQKIDRMASGYDLQECTYAGEILGCYGFKSVIPAIVFKSFMELAFEGKYYQVIFDYDTYLKATYGDYMKFPPVEKRVLKHEYDTYIEE